MEKSYLYRRHNVYWVRVRVPDKVRDKISRIENGKQAVDLNLLINISQKFNVDLHWLITGESFKSEAEEQLKACAEKLVKLNFYVERLESLINKN